MSTMITIPAKKSIVLSKAVYYYLVSLIPKGKLTTDEDIGKYLEEKFGAYVEDYNSIFYFQDNYLWELMRILPLHRVISDRGEFDSLEKSKLIEEGFEVVPKKNNNYCMKVVDYKKHLVKFGEDIEVDKELLEKINKDGYFPLSIKAE